MDLKNLYTFYTITREGGFSEAAKKLNYTQATITFHVGQLEKELDVKLFERIGRRMVLSQAGVQLIPYVEDVFQSLQRMKGFQNDIANYTGQLKIGAPESLLCFRLPLLLKEFQQKAPKTALSLFSLNSIAVKNALKDGKIDVGILYHDERNRAGSIIFEPIERYRVIVAASYKIKNRYAKIKKEDLLDSKVPKVLQPQTGSLRKKFHEYVGNKSNHVGGVIEIRSTQTIINLVKNDMGFCFLPEFVLREELDNKNLFEIPFEGKDMYISSAVAYYKNKWMSPALDLFLHMLRKSK